MKKKKNVCKNCGIEKELNELFCYVDGNNIAITKNSPLLCYDCYVKKYKK